MRGWGGSRVSAAVTRVSELSEIGRRSMRGMLRPPQAQSTVDIYRDDVGRWGPGGARDGGPS